MKLASPNDKMKLAFKKSFAVVFAGIFCKLQQVPVAAGESEDTVMHLSPHELSFEFVTALG